MNPRVYLVSLVAAAGLGFAGGFAAKSYWPKPAASVALPAQVETQPGVMIQVRATSTGPVRWRACSPGIGLFELPGDSVVVAAPTPGQYKILAWTARGDTPSEAAECTVLVTGTPPVPPPPPPPPTPTPDPPKPPPITKGKWVLIIYDKNETKMPHEQQMIITGQRVRDYLDKHCDQDGPVRAWRIWPEKAVVTGASKEWQDRYNMGRKSVPWFYASNGTSGTEGPLPGTVDEFLAALDKVFK